MSWKDGRVRAAAAMCAGLGVAVLLSGCDSVRQATGAEKTPPDEFTVLSKSPLVIPPDYDLRPPPPGIASRNDPDADETGGNLSLPTATAASLGAAYSDGEKMLLSKTNALSVDPNIRKTITIDAGLEDQGAGFAQKVLFQGPEPAKPAAAASAGMNAAPPATGARTTPPAAATAMPAPPPMSSTMTPTAPPVPATPASPAPAPAP